jgi:hypothetical protein
MPLQPDPSGVTGSCNPPGTTVANGSSLGATRFRGLGHEPLAKQENEGRDARAIDDLLRELAELRELDRRRHAHAPGSAAHDAASVEVDLRSRRLFDRFRDLQQGRESRSATARRSDLAATRPLRVRTPDLRLGRSQSS